MTEEIEHKKRSRGIYLLPNLFTTAALFSGFYGVLAAMNGRFEAAATAIFVAMVLDGLDGRVARMTHTESEFGVQYDSLSDMVSFGVAPALIMYEWSLSSMTLISPAAGKLGFMAAFIYTAGAALRLARFNTQVAIIDKAFFMGLPSPPAAAVVAGMVWLGTDLGVSGEDWRWITLITTICVGSLMVTNIPYYSFKNIDLKGKVPFVVLVAVMLAFAFASLDPPKVLFTAALVFALHGPIWAVLRWRKRKLARQTGLKDQSRPADKMSGDNDE